MKSEPQKPASSALSASKGNRLYIMHVMESWGPETSSMCYSIFTQKVILEMPQNEPTFKVPKTETRKR